MSFQPQEHARQAEHRTLELETLLDQVGDAILVVGKDFRIRRVNPTYLHMMGLRAEHAVGRNLAELAAAFVFRHTDGSPMALEELPVSRALRGEEVRNQTMVVERRDGRHIVLLEEAHPVRDPATGEILLAISAARDVTGLRQLDRLKDEFLVSASHELRTPLTLIRAMAQLALTNARRGDVAETVAELENLLEQVDRTTHLVNQLLDVSRLDTGRVTLQTRAVPLAALVQEEVERLRAAHPLHVLVSDTSQAGQPWKTVPVDPEKVLQVIENLVANAVKYSPAGSTVTLGVSDVPGGVEVWVEDQGIGIPPEDREAIFAKFYRAPNAVSSGHTGLGLGLYLSRRLVELHGGRLWLAATSERGSTFRFFLPEAGPPAPKAEQTSSTGSPLSPETAARKRRAG